MQSIVKKYDVFVSYRRDSYESANLIATRLKSEGYRVFFDLETMRAGKFNEQLYDVIDQCKDFLIVLSPGALDRCSNEDDWVRKEILRAIQTRKNIIPVLLNSFEWPETMPDCLEELPLYQGVAASRDFFDLAMERLQGYLKSRKNSKRRRLTKWIGGSLAVLIVLYFIADAIFRTLSVPVCTALVDHMTRQIGYMDLLMSDNKDMRDAFDEYDGTSKKELETLLNLMEDEKNKLEEINASEKMTLTGFQSFLLDMYGMGRTNLAAYDEYVASFFDDWQMDIDHVREALRQEAVMPSSKEFFATNLKMFEHNVNALYFTYLQIMNKIPEKSLEAYVQMSEEWSNLPKTGLGLKDKEYDRLIQREYNEADRLLSRSNGLLAGQKDEVAVMLEMQDSIYKSHLAQYQKHVRENAIVPSDAFSMNWGRIALIAGYLEVAVAVTAEEQEGDLPHPIRPQLVLSDLERMLSDFEKAHPDQAVYVASVKAFYKEVALGKRPFAGVLISAFAPGEVHDTYRLGDIIVSWNGFDVKSYEALSDASKKDGNGKVVFLHLKEGNVLEEIEIPIPGNEDVVGFSNLM